MAYGIWSTHRRRVFVGAGFREVPGLGQECFADFVVLQERFENLAIGLFVLQPLKNTIHSKCLNYEL